MCRCVRAWMCACRWRYTAQAYACARTVMLSEVMRGGRRIWKKEGGRREWGWERVGETEEKCTSWYLQLLLCHQLGVKDAFTYLQRLSRLLLEIDTKVEVGWLPEAGMVQSRRHLHTTRNGTLMELSSMQMCSCQQVRLIQKNAIFDSVPIKDKNSWFYLVLGARIHALSVIYPTFPRHTLNMSILLIGIQMGESYVFSIS